MATAMPALVKRLRLAINPSDRAKALLHLMPQSGIAGGLGFG